jgi:biotin carboxyl carrier protein
VYVWISGESYVFAPVSPTNARSSRTDQSASDEIICPVPGVVIAIQVAVGDMVEAGQELVVVESMKTEQIIKSPRDGTIDRVSVQEGDRVDRGMRLVVLTSVAETE